MSLRDKIKELLRVVAEKTVRNKLICTEYTKVPPHEVKNWLRILCSDGLIKEVTPHQDVVDFKLYSIAKKGLGLPETNYKLYLCAHNY